MSFIKQFLTTNKKPIKKKTTPTFSLESFEVGKDNFDFLMDNNRYGDMRIEFNYPLTKGKTTTYLVPSFCILRLDQGYDIIDVLYKEQFDEKFLQTIDKEGTKLFTRLIALLGKLVKEYDSVLAKVSKSEREDTCAQLSSKYSDALDNFLKENLSFLRVVAGKFDRKESFLVRNHRGIKGVEIADVTGVDHFKDTYYRLAFIAKDPKYYLNLLTDAKRRYAKYIPALKQLGEFLNYDGENVNNNDPFDVMYDLQKKYGIIHLTLTDTSNNHDLSSELGLLTAYCRFVSYLFDNIDNLIEALGLNQEAASESIKDKLSLEDDKEETSEETETSDEDKDDSESEEKENSDDKEEDDDSEEKDNEEEKDDDEEEKEDDSSEEVESDVGNDEDTSDDEENQSEDDKSDEDETEEEEEEQREDRRRRTEVRLDVPDQDVQDLAKFLASCLGDDVKEVDILKASDVNRPLYHISMNPQIKHFRPQVSQRTLNTEDRSVPRISTSTCIFGCFNGYQSIISDIQGRERKNFSGLYTVYELPFQYAVKPSPKLLPDVGNSDEYWLTSWKQETAIYIPEIAGEFFIPKTEHVYGSDTGNITLHMYLKVRTTIYLDHEQRLDRGYYYILVKNYDFKLPLKGNTEQINVHPISENEYNKINTLSIMVKKKG